MKRRILSVLLALSMILMIMPTVAMAEGETSDSVTTLAVNGILLVADGNVTANTVNGVSYNANTGILTLNDATISDVYAYTNNIDDKTYSAAIYADGDLTINVLGESNSITATGNRGIYSQGNLSFSENGKISITAKYGIEAQNISTSSTLFDLDCTSCGIHSYKDITIQGGAVEIDVTGSWAFGIWSSVTGTNRTITIIDSNVRVSAPGSSCTGINAEGPLCINNSTVYAAGSTNGLYARFAFTCLNSTLTSIGRIRVEGSANQNPAGMESSDCIIRFEGSTVNSGQITTNSWPVYLLDSEVTLTKPIINSGAVLFIDENSKIFIPENQQLKLCGYVFLGSSEIPSCIIYGLSNTHLSYISGTPNDVTASYGTGVDSSIHNSRNHVAGLFCYTNGGTFAASTTFTAGTLATPTKAGYAFVGWYDNAACTGTAVTTPAAGATYYAKWRPLTITFAEKTGDSAFIYDGATKSLTAALENTPNAVFNYTYALRTSTEGDGTYAEATATAPADAGYYKAVAALNGSDRTATSYLEIKPAAITATSKTVFVQQGDTTAQQLDLSTLELAPSLSTVGAVTYAIQSTQDANSILDGPASIAVGKLQFKLNEVVNAQHTASVDVKITPESGNYNPLVATVVIQITKDTVAPKMSANPASGADTIIYPDDNITVSFTKKMMGTPTIAVDGGTGTATAVLAENGLSMIITPADFVNSEEYTLTVNGLTDVAGNSLEANILTYTTLKLPETSGTAVPTIAGDTTVIDSEPNAMPDNITIDYTAQTTTREQDALRNAENLPSGYTATTVFFELTLKVNGIEVPNAVLNRAISITIPYAVESNTTYEVAHLKADGTVEILDATANVADQTLTFSVTSMSPFMILSKHNAAPEIPQTGVSSNMFLWIALLFISGAVLTMFVFTKNHKKAY